MQTLKRVVSIIDKALSTTTLRVSNFGQVVLIALVLLTVVHVTLRRAFHSPLSGTLEISQVMLVVVVFFSVAHCGVKKSHVSIDALLSRFPPRVQAIVNSITGLLGVLLFSAMGWGSIDTALRLMGTHRVTGILPIPIYPFYFVVAFGSLLLALVLLFQFIDSLKSAGNK